MFADETPPKARPSAGLPAVSEWALIATIIVGFLVLHILAAAMMLQTRAGENAPPPQEATSSSYD